MKKATRLFIQKIFKAKRVFVKRIEFEGCLPNRCYQNANKMAPLYDSEFEIVSGWMVGDDLGERGTAIIPHYWVFNKKTQEYFDPTPISDENLQSFEYVLDFDILTCSIGNYILPLSLKLTNDGKFKARSNDGTHYIDLDNLDVKHLYRLLAF